jgi:TonB-dependent starch-binding outer membrane protein SusC
MSPRRSNPFPHRSRPASSALRSPPGRPALLLAGLLASLLLLGAGGELAAQTGTIQGTIIDAQSGRALVGTQVSIPGTQRGVVAGAQGRYVLENVPAGEVTLRFQIIGYELVDRTVTIQAGATVTLDVQLRTRALAMDELVVTGVGQATARRQLSTSVAVLGEQAIAEAPVQSIDQLLQGRVAGSTVSAVSAQPGTGSQISFRGVSSVFGSQTPVIYIDGVRVDNSAATAPGTGGEQSSALADLLTTDIERIEVTRGGPASTLYGSDAATGVIQIFTKRGRPGAPRITARIEQGFDAPDLKYILDAGEIYPSRVESGELPADFLARSFFQTGWVQNYSLGVSGGSDNVTFNVSGRVQDAEGIQPRNESNLISTRGSLQASLTERSRLQFSGSYTRSNYGRLYNGTAIADPLTALEVGDALFFTGASTVQEATEIFLLADIEELVERTGFSGGYIFEGSDLFGFRATLGVDRRASEQTQFQPIGFTPDNEEGSLQRFQRNFTSATVDAAASINWPSTENLRSTFTVGAQGFRDNEYRIFGSGVGFALPGSKDFDDAATITAGESRSQVFTGGIYLDENLAIRDRVFLNLGVRFDAGTSFGDEVDFATYPKAGIAWDVGRESFMQDLAGRWVTEFRLRSAYGETGKFPPPFLRDRTFGATSFREESAPRFSNPGNPDLRPEVTKTFEVGFEAAFLDDRIGVDFTWYDASTEDALFFVPEQPVTGQGTQIRNVGEISNRGIEVDVSALLVNRANFSWQVGATFQTVDNEVVSMGGAAPFFVEPQKRVVEGKVVGAWFVTTPFDSNGDGNLNASEQRFIRDCDDCKAYGPTPTRSGGVSTRISVGPSLTFSARGDWAAGHKVMDFGSVWSTFNGIFRREIREEGYVYPIRYNAQGQPGNPYAQSAARSEFIYDGDWFKLREISARYAISGDLASRVGAQGGAAFFSLRNAWIWSKNPLIDPELSGLNPSGGGLALGGESSITMSPPRSFRFGLEFTF